MERARAYATDEEEISSDAAQLSDLTARRRAVSWDHAGADLVVIANRGIEERFQEHRIRARTPEMAKRFDDHENNVLHRRCHAFRIAVNNLPECRSCR